MNSSIEQQVRQRAYELWLSDGRTPGRDLDHWYAAERELLGQAQPETLPPSSKEVPVRIRKKRNSRKG